MSSLSKYTFPLVGLYMPAITLKSVVLPAPFGPIRPVIEFFFISKEVPSTALNPPVYEYFQLLSL